MERGILAVSDLEMDPKPVAMTTLPFTVRLPLPPSINATNTPMGSRLVLTAEARRWRRDAPALLMGWEPPPRTPLAMTIRLELPAVHRSDIDGYLKPILDAVIGKNRDQWVTLLKVSKQAGDGWAVVTVEAMGG